MIGLSREKTLELLEKKEKRGFAEKKPLRVNDVIYFPIPKVANSYISAVFLRNCPEAADFDPERESVLAYWKRSDAGRIAGWRRIRDTSAIRVAVVRDPGDRLVSCFHNKFVEGLKATPVRRARFCADATDRLGRDVTPENLNFGDFLEYVLRLPDDRRDRHYRTQASFLTVKCERLFALDRLGEFWAFLAEHGFDTGELAGATYAVGKTTRYEDTAGMDASRMTVPELAALPGAPRASSFLTEEMRELVAAAYAADLALYSEALGEAPEPWRVYMGG